MLTRIQKFLAHQGIASRRSIEQMIADGRISVNGQTVTKQGTKINPESDKISIDGKRIEIKDEQIYFWLNKPIGIISAASSKYGETTTADLINSPLRVYPVGRLDKDSQGLILLTNDGELTHRLTHPKFHLPKTYEVTVVGHLTESKLEKLRTGIELEEGITKPAKIDQITDQTIRFTIQEGKHRQIRRMCAAVHLHVTELIRTHFGPIELGKLELGKSRTATKTEITLLKQLVGLN